MAGRAAPAVPNGSRFGSRNGLIISVSAVVAHAGARFVGYRFGRIDLDSFVRLKRLIDLNLGDAEATARELGALAPRGALPGPD
jgi:hypothetical protein